MRAILKLVKNSIALSLRFSGLLALYSRVKLRDRVSVLTYHRVIDKERRQQTNSAPGIIVSDREFDMQMRSLRRHLHPISLDEFQAHVEDGTRFPARSCLVTFDDGWIDNYEIAFPILKKYEIPATVFLPVDFISSNQTFWQEEMMMWLTTLLRSGTKSSLVRLAKILSYDRDPSSLTVWDLRDFVANLKARTYEEIYQNLDDLRAEFKQSKPPLHYDRHMTWDQVLEMQAAGISFASHAMSHQILCRLSNDACRQELVSSRAVLEERLGKPVRALAYPNGDHDVRVMKETQAAGYTVAFSTRSGLCDRTSDPLSIPRINIHSNNSQNTALFLCRSLNLF